MITDLAGPDLGTATALRRSAPWNSAKPALTLSNPDGTIQIITTTGGGEMLGAILPAKIDAIRLGIVRKIGGEEWQLDLALPAKWGVWGVLGCPAWLKEMRAKGLSEAPKGIPMAFL